MQDQFKHPLVCGRATDNSGVCAFKVNDSHLDNLIRITKQVDFAVFLLTPDDAIDHRNTMAFAPRDNVILELGMFMGALGKKRTFFVAPSDYETRIPSNFRGITPIIYDFLASDSDPHRSVQAACRQIRDLMEDLPPLPRNDDPVETGSQPPVPEGLLIARKMNKQVVFSGSFAMQKRVVALANAQWDTNLDGWKISEKDLSRAEAR
ncbi:hypothetical protein ASD03_31730 [Ensifer sp. Root127]|nr:hypothetical protein ASD03_31730 [Ensifer sp. Root127]